MLGLHGQARGLPEGGTPNHNAKVPGTPYLTPKLRFVASSRPVEIIGVSSVFGEIIVEIIGVSSVFVVN